nr:TetR/AcrR family transcriptional regulator [Paenibacillus tuaregi]
MPTHTFFNLSAEKRSLIVSASLNEFHLSGFEKASIARIVAAAGIARGSFYQYFDDIKDLYRYLIVEVIGQQKHNYSTLSVMNRAPFTEIVRDLFYGGIRFYIEQPVMAKVAQDFLKIRDTALIKEITGDSIRKSAEYFRSLIEERKAAGEIDGKIDTEALHHFIATLSLTISETLRDKDVSAWDHQALTEHVNKYVYILNNALGGTAK